MAFITAADGQGLADRTQRRFFSDGSLPDDAVVDRGTTPAEVMVDARGSLPYAYPRLPRLELKAMGRRHYAYTHDKRRLLAYERVPGRVRFFLDEAVYADTARALLPEIAGYGAGLIDHLFRAEIRIDAAGRRRAVSVVGARGRASGRARSASSPRTAAGARKSLADVAAGFRRRARDRPRRDTKKVAAVLRGEDDAGELVAVAEAAVR